MAYEHDKAQPRKLGYHSPCACYITYGAGFTGIGKRIPCQASQQPFRFTNQQQPLQECDVSNRSFTSHNHWKRSKAFQGNQGLSTAFQKRAYSAWWMLLVNNPSKYVLSAELQPFRTVILSLGDRPLEIRVSIYWYSSTINSSIRLIYELDALVHIAHLYPEK